MSSGYAKEVDDDVKAHRTDRGPLTIYVSRELFKRFKNKCDKKGYSASEVVEALMRQYLGEKAKRK